MGSPEKFSFTDLEKKRLTNWKKNMRINQPFIPKGTETYWECPVCFQRGTTLGGFNRHFDKHTTEDIEEAERLNKEEAYEGDIFYGFDD